MGSFSPAVGCGAAKILRKATTVQNGAESRFVHLERGRKRRDIRRQIDNRPDVQVAIRPAIQTPPMPGAGSKKPVTPTIESSLSSARARKKRNPARFMIGLLLLLVCMLRSRGCPDFCLPRDRLAAAAGFVSAIAGESHHTRNERDPRSVAELTFSEASSGGAEFCAPAFLKTSFAGQSLNRPANSAARKKHVGSITPKQPHSTFNPRAREPTRRRQKNTAISQMPR
jgi:hypothetical protein